jgi:hypothetical protein
MREVWPKAKPAPSALVKMAMQRVGIRDLEGTAKNTGVDVVRLETAMLRLAKNFLRKGKVMQIKIRSPSAS